MFKIVTIYRQVDDPDKLEDFFANTHLHLAEQLPGLRRSEVSRVIGKPGGESRFHLMYELYFDTKQAYGRALGSKPGVQLMRALKPWADARIITWFHAESFAETAVPPADEEE